MVLARSRAARSGMEAELREREVLILKRIIVVVSFLMPTAFSFALLPILVAAILILAQISVRINASCALAFIRIRNASAKRAGKGQGKR